MWHKKKANLLRIIFQNINLTMSQNWICTIDTLMIMWMQVIVTHVIKTWGGISYWQQVYDFEFPKQHRTSLHQRGTCWYQTTCERHFMTSVRNKMENVVDMKYHVKMVLKWTWIPVVLCSSLDISLAWRLCTST